jgi:MFS family permease
MPPAIKSVLSVLGAAVVGYLLFFVVQNISSAMYSLPDSVHMDDGEALAGPMAALPLGAFMLVLLSYAIGSFVAGWMAARYAPSSPVGHAVAVGVLLTLVGLINLTAFRHPTWYIVVNVPEFILFAWLGGLAGRPGVRPRPSPAT